MVDPLDLLDSRDRRNRGAGARRDQDAVCRQVTVADAHRMRVHERGLSLDELVARASQDLEPAVLGATDRVLPGAHTREVDACRAAVDAHPFAQLVDGVGELRGDEVGLRGPAGDVGAAAAPALALDERHARSVLA